MNLPPPIVVVSRANDLPQFTIQQLRSRAAWIRDNLEPGIAHEGPRVLEADTVLELNDFFIHLRIFNIDYETIRQSRIHRAILLVCGRGTRWPKKLVDICDLIVEEWTERFGELSTIWPTLYGPGGRLFGVGEPKGLSRQALVMKWMADPTSMVSPLRALEHGNLEFHPGQWWIHPLFAFRDGIIDSPDSHGGITLDHDGVYAITLTGYDEVDGETFGVFTYRCRTNDRSKYRLLRAFLPPKQPLRILRSHTLHSIWSPVAGLRYDGLYHIIGYSWIYIKSEPTLDVKLERQISQVSMATVLSHPTAEEIEDYVEYKRLREIKQQRHKDYPDHAHQVLPDPALDTSGFDPVEFPKYSATLPKPSSLKKSPKLSRPPLREPYGSDDSIMQVALVRERKGRVDPHHARLFSRTDSGSDDNVFSNTDTEPKATSDSPSALPSVSSSTLKLSVPKKVSISGFTDGPSDTASNDDVDVASIRESAEIERRDSAISFARTGPGSSDEDQKRDMVTVRLNGLSLVDDDTSGHGYVDYGLADALSVAEINTLARKCEHLYEQIAFRGVATDEAMEYLEAIRCRLQQESADSVDPEFLEELQRLKNMIGYIDDIEGVLPCSPEIATTHFIILRDERAVERRGSISKQYRLSAGELAYDLPETSWECPFQRSS